MNHYFYVGQPVWKDRKDEQMSKFEIFKVKIMSFRYLVQFIQLLGNIFRHFVVLRSTTWLFKVKIWQNLSVLR